MCCGPRGRKESDTVERLNNNTYMILLSTQDRNTQKVWKIQAKKIPGRAPTRALPSSLWCVPF